MSVLVTSNWDQITSQGNYKSKGIVVNESPGSLLGRTCVVKKTGSNTIQEMKDNNGNPTLYTRTYNGSVWTAWSETIKKVRGNTINGQLKMSVGNDVVLPKEKNIVESGFGFDNLTTSKTFGQFNSLAFDSENDYYITHYDFNGGDLAITSSKLLETKSIYDGGGDAVGEYISIDIDSKGYLHVAFYNNTDSSLMYGTFGRSAFPSKSFTAIEIDNTAIVGTHTSITVDGNDKIHISYYDATNDTLKYATNASGSWLHETVDNIGTTGQYTSIKIDSGNVVHIAFLDSTTSQAKHAYGSYGSWTIDVVETDADISEYLSMDLDADDYVHMAYRKNTADEIVYATNVSGSFATETVNSTDVGIYLSIGIDSAGKAHISHRSASSQNLVYETNKSGSWVSQVVDNNGNTGAYTSLKVDSNDYVHISYYHQPTGKVTYTTNKTGSWVFKAGLEQITGNDNGRYSAMVLDENDEIFIVSYQSTGQEIVYSTGLIPGTILIDTSGDTGRNSIINIHSNDDINVTYRYVTSSDLVYTNSAVSTTKNPAQVILDLIANRTLVDTTSAVSFPGSTIDQNGKTHASYVNTASNSLRYARNVSGWQNEQVIGSNIATHTPGIVVDSVDTVHMFYYDSVSGNVKVVSGTFGSWGSPVVVDGNNNLNSSSTDNRITACPAIDSDGTIHLAYANYNTGKLMYTNNSSGWITPVAIDDSFSGIGIGAGLDCDLIIDSQDNMYVSYAVNGKFGARVAIKNSGSSTWDIIDATKNTSDVSMKVFNNSGNVSIYLSARKHRPNQLFYMVLKEIDLDNGQTTSNTGNSVLVSGTNFSIYKFKTSSIKAGKIIKVKFDGHCKIVSGAYISLPNKQVVDTYPGLELEFVQQGNGTFKKMGGSNQALISRIFKPGLPDLIIKGGASPAAAKTIEWMPRFYECGNLRFLSGYTELDFSVMVVNGDLIVDSGAFVALSDIRWGRGNGIWFNGTNSLAGYSIHPQYEAGFINPKTTTYAGETDTGGSDGGNAGDAWVSNASTGDDTGSAGAFYGGHGGNGTSGNSGGGAGCGGGAGSNSTGNVNCLFLVKGNITIAGQLINSGKTSSAWPDTTGADNGGVGGGLTALYALGNINLTGAQLQNQGQTTTSGGGAGGGGYIWSAVGGINISNGTTNVSAGTGGSGGESAGATSMGNSITESQMLSSMDKFYNSFFGI